MDVVAAPTALVINDDPSQLLLTASLLEREGLHVVSCQNAEEAVRMLHTGRKVDVIVTDLHMPYLDGWRFCQLLRSPEYAAFNAIPVLVVSATFSGTDAEQMTTDLGANAFLPVPYNPTTLRACVRDLLAGRRPRTALRVLLVQDDPAQAALLQHTFATQGYVVDLARTGADGHRLLQQYRPDITILDYHLPDMTGDQLLTTFIRPASPTVAIVVSANPTPEIALQCMRLGADGYVRKPFDSTYVLDLSVKARCQRALLRVEGLLEERTREIRASEAKLRTLFNSIPDAVLVHDAQGIVLYVNQAGAQWLSWPAAALIGRPLRDILTPQSLTEVNEHIQHTLTTGASSLKTVYVSQTGRHLEAEVNKRRMEFEGQVASLDVARDLTARTRLETHLRQMQKLQAVSTLAAGIAHEFNNLLAVVLGYTELTLEEQSQEDPTRPYLEQVLRATGCARDLVQQIVAFSRQSPLARRPLQLSQVIHEGLRMLQVSLPSTVTLHVDLPTTAALILADATQFHQVLTHLWTNAVHAMRDTEGVLEVRLEALDMSAEMASAYPPLQPGPYCRLTVRDTGHGMTPEVLEHIFDPFFTTKDVGEGTGLGLSVVQGIVASHGGVMAVTSTPGEGTLVEMYLPQLRHGVASEAPTIDAPMPGGHERILVVDDELALTQLARETLTNLGYAVATYTSSTEALNVFRHAPQHFDLVLTDYAMPGLNGEALVREIRGLRPTIPIILCSGLYDPLSPEQIAALGIHVVLTKPYVVRDLGRTVRRVLDQQQEI